MCLLTYLLTYFNLPKSHLNRLQLIQNSLARAVVNIYTGLKLLKINERIDYKLLSLTYKVLTTTEPSYLKSLFQFNSLETLVPSLLSPFLDHHLFSKLQIAHFVMHHPISGISFLSHFVSLLISLLHIHRTSFMAVHVQYIIIIIISDLLDSFSLSFSAQNLSFSQVFSTIFSCTLPLDCLLGLRRLFGLIMLIGLFIVLSLFLFSFWSRVVD